MFKIAFIAFLIGAAIIFGFAWKIFLTWPWEFYAYIIIGGYIFLCVALLIVGYITNYYVFEKNFILVRRFNKEFTIDYNNVMCIDERQSEKRKMVCIGLNQGKTFYLLFDKNQKVYQEFLNKCHHLISVEEYRQKFPKTDL